LGDGGKMQFDVDPFPVNAVGFEEKKILVQSDQASTTKGKNVIMSNELRNRILKPRSPEIGIWNLQHRYLPTLATTSHS
jgi:hypothetical protein